MAAGTVLNLTFGWEVRSTDTDDTVGEAWMPVRQVPTEVHVDLLDNGKIKDPFLDMNELRAHWVADHDWVYRTRFATPNEACALDTGKVVTDLVLQGLDTFATVTLNGVEILQSDNMFVEHRVPVRDILKPTGTGETNTLTITFTSPRKRGLELVKAHPEHRFIVHQTEISRGPVRKAQYHWGWDWGPILLSSGPWKPIFLETWSARISNVKVTTSLSDDLSRAQICVSSALHGRRSSLMVEATLLYSQQVQQKVQLESKDSHKTKNGAETYTAYFEVDQPKVWWPHGYGSQPLYEILLHVIGEDGSTVLATESKKIGICRTELVQDDDNFGRSFFFRINGVDVFAGGSCWVPADSFATRVSAERYRDWIRLVRDGNQVMLRVWGGGLYEADAFYDACDELGVLVWQDFAFACANYPAYPDYLRSVEREARQNVQRLRHHPSLIIWAGNNEDYQIVERYGLEYKPEDHDPTSWLKTGFPARYIYEHLLPRVVEEESPGTIYRPSSPWGNGKSTTLQVDPTIGGVHEWNVWNGPMRLLQDLPDMGGRFISEFGMEAYPHVETLRACISDSAQRYPGSMVVDFHNKAVGHERRLGAYLVENYRLPCRLADTVGNESHTEGLLKSYIHLTQMVQADTLSVGYKSWRRQWGVTVTDTTAGITGMASNPKTTTTSRQCGGVLAWQLNDCWPCISWSIADSRMVRKPAFYAIRRALQRPLAVGVHRVLPQRDWTMRRADGRLWQRDTGHLDPAAGWRRGESTVFDVWVASSSIGPDPIIAHVVVRFISVSTGADVRSEWGKTVSVMPNQTTEVFSRSSVVVDSREQTRAPGRDFSSSLGEVDPFIIRAIVYVDGRLVSSDTSWPEPIKYLDLRDRGVRLNYNSDNSVAVTAEKPVKGFVFMEEKGVALSDNGFDVIPGEKPKVVRVEGLDVQELEWTFVQE